MRFSATKALFILALILLTGSLTGEVSITITNPVEGSVIEPCIDMTVKTEVTATAGEVIKYLYLYNNGRTLRRLRNEPWEYEWKAVKKGVYELSAKVETEDGAEIWSNTVRYKVGSVSGGEKLYSGGFDCGVLSPWTQNFNEGAQAIFTVYDDGYFDDPYYLAIEIENAGSADWHIQLNQTCPTDSGHIYTITFLADSDEPKTIAVGMQENQDPWANQVWQNVDIDGVDEYGFEFTATRTDPTNVLRFNVGGNTIPFYIDDISVVDQSASAVKSQQFEFHGGLVSEYELFQAFPNPFNMNTTIRYSLSNPADVSLDIYNMTGQKVRTLVKEAKPHGQHAAGWDGINEYGDILPSGVYIYRLEVNDGSDTAVLSRKVLLMK